jgi:hypothetical protein
MSHPKTQLGPHQLFQSEWTLAPGVEEHFSELNGERNHRRRGDGPICLCEPTVRPSDSRFVPELVQRVLGARLCERSAPLRTTGPSG